MNKELKALKDLLEGASPRDIYEDDMPVNALENIKASIENNKARVTSLRDKTSYDIKMVQQMAARLDDDLNFTGEVAWHLNNLKQVQDEIEEIESEIKMLESDMLDVDVGMDDKGQKETKYDQD